MKYKALIFDLDGTVLSTFGDISAAVNKALSEYGLPTLTESEMKPILGYGYEHLIHHAVPNGTPKEIEKKVYDFYYSYYHEHSTLTTKPYDGIMELLANLKNGGCKTAIVSNKQDVTVKSLIELYFPDLFDSYCGESETIRRKPYPDTVNAVLKDLGIDRKDAAYIGDSEVDVMTANNCDMDCLAVSWGFRTRKQLEDAGAKYIFDNVEEFSHFVLE